MRLNPNGKIPVLIDRQDNRTLFESAAILSYLAKRQGQLGGESEDEYWWVQQWLSFQIASVGPMLGQLWWFRHSSVSQNNQALERYSRESHRLYHVLETQLSQHPFVAGEHYSIADIALFPWLRSHEELELDIEPYPAVRQWLRGIAQRPAVMRGLKRASQ